MSEILKSSDEHAAERPLSTGVAVSTSRSTPASSPHSHKFRAVMATLFGVALGALIVAAAILVSGGKAGPTGKWSDWSPSDDGNLGAREIADHLAPFYRISNVDQLDVVTVANLSNQNAATQSTTSPSSGLQIAVHADPTSSAVSLLSGKTIAYNLCGIGSSNCVIGVGKPSADRLLLLRREALELALYTFRYISGAQNVVAILPPGHTTQQCSGICPRPNAKATTKPVDIALLFLRDELSPWLSRPLSDTFPEQFPPYVSQMPLWKQTPEAGLVEQITARGLFSERVVQEQDGSNLLVLDPLPPQ
jgi:hypothetical protein